MSMEVFWFVSLKVSLAERQTQTDRDTGSGGGTTGKNNDRAVAIKVEDQVLLQSKHSTKNNTDNRLFDGIVFVSYKDKIIKLPVELFHCFIGQVLLFAAILPNYQQEPQVTREHFTFVCGTNNRVRTGA